MLFLASIGLSCRRLSRDRRLIAGLGAAVVLATTRCGNPSLRPDRPIHAEIAGGGQQPFSLELARNQAVTIVLEQHDADLTLTVTGPSGRDVIDMRERGRETATLVTDAPARFSVVIQARNAAQTRVPFDLSVDVPHAAGDRDRQWQKAERLESKAKDLATTRREAFGEALASLDDAQRLWRALGDQTGQATTLARKGDIYYAGNQFEQSEKVYTEALALLRPLNQPHQLAVIENNLGVGQHSRGFLADARTHFRAALEVWASLPEERKDRAATLANEGAMLVESGDYQSAIARLREAQPLLQNDPRSGPAVLNNLGVAYRALGDLDAADQCFTSAGAALTPSDPRVERLRLRRAQIALARGDVEGAAATARDALTAIRASRNTLAEADALDLLGEVTAASGHLDDAVARYDEARALYEKLGARRGMATALHHIGAVDRLRRRLPDARAALTRALDLRQKIGLRDAEAETHYELALLEIDSHAPEAARAQLMTAIAAIEDVRGRVSGEYSRSVYFASRQKYFSTAIELLLQLHAAHPAAGYAKAAFDMSERERARSLIDVLRESGTDIRRGVSPALLEQERDEQRQLDFWATRVFRFSNDNTPAGIVALATATRQMNAHLTAYREIDSRIRAMTTPKTAAGPVVLGLADIQRELLDANTQLLRFVLGERRSYAFVVRRDSIAVVPLPPKAQIERDAERLATLMRTRPTPGNVDAAAAEFQRVASALGDTLFKQLASHLGGPHLLIVAEGMLQVVPFAALPMPATGKLLIESHEVAMLPSASAIAILRRQIAARPKPTQMLAIFADAVYEKQDPRVDKDQRQPDIVGEHDAIPIMDVSRLMLSQTEARSIAQYAPKEQVYTATDFAANRDALSRVSDHRIIHFATHALADDARPELSALILSQYDRRGRRQRGVVRLNELTTGLTLRADVVVLSACSSAIGRDMPGEGVMGLARGFFSAGAASVIASLKNVEEEPTLELMQHFYGRLLGDQHLRAAAALQAAQREMMKSRRFASPIFWAPFVFIGDPR